MVLNQFRYNHLILFLLVFFADSWLEDGGLCYNCIIRSTLSDNYQDLGIRQANYMTDQLLYCNSGGAFFCLWYNKTDGNISNHVFFSTVLGMGNARSIMKSKLF